MNKQAYNLIVGKNVCQHITKEYIYVSYLLLCNKLP